MKNLTIKTVARDVPSVLMGMLLLFFILVYNRLSATVYVPKGLFYGALLTGGVVVWNFRNAFRALT
ncbi:MAG: hypothetical protein LUD15_12520 [Bacteroides sp.]|nr:hypothetical protein [Bacteroides sp.]